MIPIYKKFYKKTKFRVRRPIRSFRDLEVYQRTAKASVEIMKSLLPLLTEQNCPVKEKLVDCCLEVPRLIGKSHSKRFDDPPASLVLLEEVMSLCNDAVVYLEQIRDIYVEDVNKVILDEIIKEYFYSRRKIFNLYKAWKRMDEEYGGKAS